MNKAYWDHRYASGNTGWDLNKASAPLTHYIDQINDRGVRILIPGAGNAYEAEYLLNQGFNHLSVLDIAEAPLRHLRGRLSPEFKATLIHDDFFKHQGQYDLILEQTFFCALDPDLRPNYVEKMHDLLAPGGRLAGVLFDFPLSSAGPPLAVVLEPINNSFNPILK